MLNLSLDELKLFSKNRVIKDYEKMSKNKLLSILKATKPIKRNNIDKILKNTRTLFRLEKDKDIKDSVLGDIRNLFSLEKDKCIKDRVLGDIGTLYESKEDYYKPIRTGNVFSSNYIEYESKGDKDKTLSIEEYLDIIRPYLSDLIDKHKTQGEGEMHLTMAINFIFSKDSDETHTMHTKSDNIEIMMGRETDEIVEELFQTLLQRYQEGLEESVTGSEFVFYSVDLLYHKLHEISLNRGESYIDSPKLLKKNKKATINPKNNDDKCSQYAVTVALNYQNIKNNPEKIRKIKPFIDQYNWKEISFPSNKNDWKKFESNNNQLLLISYMCLTILKK